MILFTPSYGTLDKGGTASLNSDNVIDDVGKKRARLNRESIFFVVAIAMSGVVAAGIEPSVSVVPLLPLSAALELVAGLRLGPLRGTLAAMVGGFVLAMLTAWPFISIEIIQNPLLAGSLTNALLPSLLSRLLRSNVFTHGETTPEKKTILRLFIFLMAIILMETLPYTWGTQGIVFRVYIPVSALFLFYVAGSAILPSISKEPESTLRLLMILVVGAFMSSLIASARAISMEPWDGVANAFVPWFLWDIIYSIVAVQFLLVLDFGGLKSFGQTENTTFRRFQTRYKKQYHALVYVICLLYFAWVWFHFDTDLRGCDLHCYLLAANSNFSGYPVKTGIIKWMYPRFTAFLWRPFLHFKFETTYAIMFIIGCSGYLLLTHELLKKDMGGIIALTGLKALQSQLGAGNIYPLLAALATNPLGIVVDTLFKFPIAAVGFFLLIVQYNRRKNNANC